MRRVALCLFFALCTAGVSGETLLIADKAADELLYFDTLSGKVIQAVPVGGNPHEVVLTRDERYAITSNSRSNTLSMVDVAAAREIERLSSERFAYPHGMAVLHDGTTLLLTSEQNQTLFSIDLERFSIAGALGTEMNGSHMVLLSPDGARAYMTNRESNTVTLLDTSGRGPAVVKHAPAGAGAEGIALSPDGRTLLVANRNDNDVYLYDADTLERTARIAVGEGPVRAVFSPDGVWALVSHRASDQVQAIRLATEAVEARTKVGEGPGGIVFLHDGSRAFVANTSGGTLSVLEVGSFRVTSTHDAGEGPDGMVALVASVVGSP